MSSFIIKLNNASFTHNIGTSTSVPIELRDDTEAYLTAIPTAAASMSDTKKQAINTFLANVKGNTELTSNISGYYFPIYGNNEGFVNLLNPTENLNYPSTCYGTFDANGLTPSQGWDTSISVNRRNFLLGFYNTTASPNADTEVSVGVDSGAQVWVGRRHSTGGAGCLYDSSTRLSAGSVTGTGLVLGMNDYDNSIISVMVDGEYNSNALQFGSDLDTNIVIGNAIAESTSANVANYAHGMFVFGSNAISEANALLLDGYVNTLMTALLS